MPPDPIATAGSGTAKVAADDADFPTLPDGATADQKALKAGIDELRQIIGNGVAKAPQLLELLPELRRAAELGFVGVGGAPPDPAQALATLDPLRAKARAAFAAVAAPAAIAEPPPTAPPAAALGAAPGAGAFRVTIPSVERDEQADPRDLDFELKAGIDAIPAEQMALKGEIEDTLTTLQVIFPEKNWATERAHKHAAQRRFEQYQYKLLSLAQVGLEASPAYPAVAAQALNALKAEVLAREGARVKNGYMLQLGLWALGFAMLAAAIYALLGVYPTLDDTLQRYRNLWVLWTGCMIGTWLSFGSRRVVLTFGDLGKLENDMLEPSIRLLFTGLMTIAIALIFISGMVNVEIGGFKTDMLLHSGSRALLVGVLCGISEQALPGTVNRRAAQFLSELGSK